MYVTPRDGQISQTYSPLKQQTQVTLLLCQLSETETFSLFTDYYSSPSFLGKSLSLSHIPQDIFLGIYVSLIKSQCTSLLNQSI